MKVDGKLKARLLLVCGVMVVGLSLLSARLVYVQVVKHGKYAEAAAAHYRHKEVLPGSRGMILDRNGDLLARNQTVYTLFADCHHLRDPLIGARGVALKEGIGPRTVKMRYTREEIADRYLSLVVDTLAEPLRLPKDDLRRRLNEKENGEIVLGREIEEDFSRELDRLMEKHRVGGVYLRRSERRFYPSPLTLTHVLGYVGEREGSEEGAAAGAAAIEGKEGVERTFDAAMTGRDGYRYIERDRKLNEIHAFRGDERAPAPGNNVRLTIDMSLQVAVEEILDEVWERYAPEKVSTVWMDPRTGEVLAMASRPHFDLATREGVRRNIAASDVYEPGSTFKVVGIGGALDRGLVNLGTEIDCHLGMYDKEGFELADHHPYGVLTVEKVVSKSSNIGAYLIARQLGAKSYFDYIQAFGFGEPTGVELTAESPGILHPPGRWNLTSYSRLAMGYSISVTPLQMAAAYAAIANDGVMRRPTVLRWIEDAGGQVVENRKPSEDRRVIGEKAAKQLRQALAKVTEEGGTGTRASLPGYPIAGKTGTAQKYVNGHYPKGRYVVSFAGFLPAGDPQLVGIVVVDDPHASNVELYGGTIAAPVFSEISAKAVRILGIRPDNFEEHRLAESTPAE
ncbi:MAG: penicillin-binding protein 2 [Akkermansiaceae bacterium]|nr:penicillin-binding protein 2 [Akkermansiaceae bacterium]MCP5551854.1 penicillin-binding protein 2 [Akkermansiaceae bacterium]